MSLRRPTNHNGSNATSTPFEGVGMRNCMTCGRWRPQAGGGKDRRTGFWRCACCIATRTPPPQAASEGAA